MLLLYFEKRAKDGLPDPNGHVRSDWQEQWPVGGGLADYPLSRQHLKERNMVHTIARYINSYSYSTFSACNLSWIDDLVNQDRFLRIFLKILVLKYFRGYP